MMGNELSAEEISPKMKFLLHVVACPYCGNPDLIQGQTQLDCRCGRSFPLHDGVPDFTDDRQSTVQGFEYQWAKRREGAFESTTLYGKSKEEELRQFFQFLNLADEDIRDKVILDAGCGSGRLTMLLGERGLNVIGMDLTTTVFAIAAQESATAMKNITLIRGNLLSLPLKKNVVDVIWSGGVLHHTGDTRASFHHLVGALRLGGKIYIWLYSVNQGIFGRIRQLLPFAHRLPSPILLCLCWLLAVPVWALGVISRKYHAMAEIRFKLFDHLAPRFRTVHSEKEVVSWFVEEGLVDVEVVIPQTTGGVGVRGTKLSS
jgi:SAM-dependent methyltransferase